jgi:type II secretory pathway component GspD/PulD (secretin)
MRKITTLSPIPLRPLAALALVMALALLTAGGAWAQQDLSPDDAVGELSPDVLPLDERDMAPLDDMMPESVTSFGGRDATITQFLHIIERDLGATFMAHGAVAEEMLPRVAVQNATLDDLIGRFGSEYGWRVVPDELEQGVYHLYTEEDYAATVLPTLVIEKSFFLENITAESTADLVQEILSEVGSLAVISRTNEIIVTDLPQYVEAVERLLVRIDQRLILRVFRIRHANVEDVEAAIERLLSADGRMEVDYRNHTIIVEDLFRNIRRMDLMVEILDVGTELRTYPLNYLSEDDVAALDDALRDIVTPDALLTFDERTGLVILDDIPEVHERAAEIIEAFDTPTRQIMLQAELIQVRTSNVLNIETQFDVAGDLFAGAADTNEGNFTTLGNVPTGITRDVTDGLGFGDVRGTFPVFSMDSGGVSFEYLSSHFRAMLSASLANSNSRLLLSPRIQVKDQETAVIDVGGEVPFVTTTYDNSSSGNRTFTQQAVREGLLLEVTPFITNTGYVELQLRLENNDATVTERKVVDGTIEVVDRRTQQVETVLIIPDGATRVIAGLLSSTDQESHSGVPYLSNLPYVGWLFGKTNNEEVRDNLMIFLTPTILVETATDFEWRPHFDERPVSNRFATPVPEDLEPVRPPDVERMLPAIPDLPPEAVEEILSDPTWMEDDPMYGIPPILPEGVDPSVEPVPMPPRGPGIAAEEVGAFRGPPPLRVEPTSPEAMWGEEEEIMTLPLVSEDLRIGEDGQPMTSFREGGRPVIRGSLPTEGSVGRTTVPGVAPRPEDGEREDQREEPGRRPPRNETRVQ